MSSSIQTPLASPPSSHPKAATRDPAVAADGSRPSTKDGIRLGVGFTLDAIVCAIPWIGLGSIALPQLLDQIDPGSREAMLGLINGVGSVVALLANIIFGTCSDLTRSRFGRRSPWIISGGILTGLCVFGLIFTRSIPLIILLWCGAQMFYNWMKAPFIATMSDRVPDKFRGTISSFYGAGVVLGQTLGSLIGALFISRLNSAFGYGALAFGFMGVIVVLIWPREQSNKDVAREPVSLRMMLSSFRPPIGRSARNFWYALSGRLLLVSGYTMISTYQLYIVKYHIYKGSKVSAAQLSTMAAGLIAKMAVVTLVASLASALLAGPITDFIKMRKLPVALAGICVAVGVAMPWIFPSEMGMYLFALIAGLGYGVYNAIDQALNVQVLPNPDEAGKDLGILNISNTLSHVIGVALTSWVVVAAHGNYTMIFPVSIAIVLVASFLIMRIKGVR